MKTFFKKVFNKFRGNVNEESAESDALLERHQVLVENLAAALVIRSSTGEITYCSPYTEVLTGYPLKEIYNSSEDFFLSVTKEDDRENYQRALDLAKVGESFQVRFRFYHRTGIEMCAEARTAPLFDENGAFISSITILLDVTQTVKQERLLAERNEDLRNITSVVAEEIQNEVFTIQGMLQLLNDSISEAEMKEGLQSSAVKLEQLAEGLTEFGKATQFSGDVRPIPLDKTLEELIAERAGTKNSIELVWEDSTSEVDVYANKLELKEALHALLNHAETLLEQSDNLKASLIVTKENDHVKVHLKDNAREIPAQMASHIFTPYRAHRSRTPFSLSLAKKRIQRLGGTLEYISGKDQDSCFELSLRSR